MRNGTKNGNFKHGLARTKLDSVFNGMIQRCENPKLHNYANYGGKGIAVCAEWRNDRAAFFKWALQNGYAEGLTIDRIEASKDYSPDNCRWVTYDVQQSNKSNFRLLTLNGKTLNLSAWGKEIGVQEATLRARLESGWSVEKALTTGTRPMRQSKNLRNLS